MMMKKIVLILMLLTSVVYAQCGERAFANIDKVSKQTSQCGEKCTAPYGLSSNVSRFFSSVTGQNFLAERVGSSLIKKAVKKNITSGDIKADLKSFSVRDLKEGKFKSIEIKGKDINVQGVYISSFNAKTLCDFNYIVDDKKGNVIVKEDIPMALDIVITEDDLIKTMKSDNYMRIIGDVNKLSSGLFEIDSTFVRLKNNKMYYVVKYNLPFVRQSKQVVLSADLCVDDGKIVLANVHYAGKTMKTDISKFSKLLNYINPLDFSAKILENKDAKFNIKTVKVVDKKINVNGIVTILKDKE